MSHNTSPYDPQKKALGRDKLSRIPVKVDTSLPILRKPDWIRIRLPSDNKVANLKKLIQKNQLVTVCEEAACPNLHECFSHGTATFMIMGDKCTRRCSFCNVGHGRPDPLDPNEPTHLADTIHAMQLKYVVITSVDRDDLRDGGGAHFTACVNRVREKTPDITVEVLVPDFRGRLSKAFLALAEGLPDVFNHNIETVPRLYKQARPGSDYQWSLKVLQEFKTRFPNIPTKSGMMLGLGESMTEVKAVMQDLRAHHVDRLTLGQYLQPTPYHMPVAAYYTPQEFQALGDLGKTMGFSHVASGPLVRSSYQADLQAQGKHVS